MHAADYNTPVRQCCSCLRKSIFLAGWSLLLVDGVHGWLDSSGRVGGQPEHQHAERSHRHHADKHDHRMHRIGVTRRGGLLVPASRTRLSNLVGSASDSPDYAGDFIGSSSALLGVATHEYRRGGRGDGDPPDEDIAPDDPDGDNSPAPKQGVMTQVQEYIGKLSSSARGGIILAGGVVFFVVWMICCSGPKHVPVEILPAATGENPVGLVLLVKNVDYDALNARIDLRDAFEASVREVIAGSSSGLVYPSSVRVALTSGSVRISASVFPPSGVTASAVQAALNMTAGDLPAAVLLGLKSLDGFDDVTAKGFEASVELVSLPVEQVTDPVLKQLRRQKAQLLFQDVVRRDKLKKCLGKIVQKEAEATTPLTDEEVQKKAMKAMAAVDIMAENNLVSAMAYAMPAMAQGKRVAQAFEKRKQALMDRQRTLMYEESSSLASDMAGVFDVGETGPDIFSKLQKIDLPSFATILAGALAPMQLKLINLTATIIVIQTLLTLSLSLTAFVLSLKGLRSDLHRLSCVSDGWLHQQTDDAVHLWFAVDVSVSMFSFIVRWREKQISGALIERLESPPALPDSACPAETTKLLLDYYLSEGAQALMSIDSLSNSLIGGLANWVVLFNTLWMFLGTDIALNTEWRHCPAIPLVCLRIRVIVFLILFVPALVTLGFWFADKALRGEGQLIAALRVAQKIDKESGLGLPIAQIAVCAFLGRKREDMLMLQVRLLEMKKMKLETERSEAETKLQETQAAADLTNAELTEVLAERDAEALLTQEERFEKLEKVREDVTKEAEVMFGKVNEAAMTASALASKQMTEWKEGDGPEFIQALAKGEGLSKLQEYADTAKDTEQFKSAYAQAQGVAESAQRSAEEVANSEEFQSALAQAQDVTASAQEVAASAVQDERVQAAVAQAQTAADQARHDA